MTALYPNSQDVAHSFSRSAESYNRAAVLQQHVANQLLRLLQPQGKVLDLGCGTGVHTETMASLPQVEGCTGLDIASGMINYAKQHSQHRVRYVQANACETPFASSTFNSIFSSLMVQWLGASPSFFSELARLLAPNGQAGITTLLDGTLFELKQAWQQVDNGIHVNEFEPLQPWLVASEQAGLELVLYKTEVFTRYFDTVKAALQELKALGAHNVNPQRKQGLMGRKQWQRLQQAYEVYRTEGQIPASYHVLYLVVKKRG